MQAETMLTANARVCDECIAFVDSFSAEVYRHVSDSHSSIGAHIRHTIEFFQCLLTGIGSEDKHIDYDNRARDTRLEIDKAYAIVNLKQIKRQVLAISDISQAVTVNETVSPEVKADYKVASTIGRELMFAHSHMVHHFGIIKLLAEKQNIVVDEDFGKAPSTLVYEKNCS